MFAEDQRSSGNLLSTSSVQCSAGTDHQAAMPDQRAGDLLPAALSSEDVPSGEANLPRTQGHLLLAQAGKLCGAGSGRRSTGTVKQSGNSTRSTGRRCSSTGS
jgi:hypothetical protein